MGSPLRRGRRAALLSSLLPPPPLCSAEHPGIRESQSVPGKPFFPAACGKEALRERREQGCNDDVYALFRKTFQVFADPEKPMTDSPDFSGEGKQHFSGLAGEENFI